MTTSNCFRLMVVAFALLFITHQNGKAQTATPKCASFENWTRNAGQNPDLALRRAQLEQETQAWIQNLESRKAAAVVTIPVVVHVIYKEAIENVSDAQIQSQIQAMNEDFRALNSDSLGSSHPFKGLVGDAEIEFCLASQDPNGNPTTGITRTLTDTVGFSASGSEKFTASGGHDNWAPTSYLNIWVANLGNSGGVLGYATFPDELASDPGKDGVVIDYHAFGTTGTAGTGQFPFATKGRTGTHEVGHWLNLYHIWGDANCGDDQVADTPPQVADNAGCPTFPYNANSSCGAGANGEMFMNFMDYVDDECMVMFSEGQALRMKAAMNLTRTGLATSLGCSVSAAQGEVLNREVAVQLYPNPTRGMAELRIQGKTNEKASIVVYDLLGSQVFHSESTTRQKEHHFVVDLEGMAPGIYLVKARFGQQTAVQKLTVAH